MASLVPHSAPEAAAIARAADGRELARTTVYGNVPDPIRPESSGPVATEEIDAVLDEACATASDGTVTCSVGGSETTETGSDPQSIDLE